MIGTGGRGQPARRSDAVAAAPRSFSKMVVERGDNTKVANNQQSKWRFSGLFYRLLPLVGWIG